LTGRLSAFVEATRGNPSHNPNLIGIIRCIKHAKNAARLFVSLPATGRFALTMFCRDGDVVEIATQGWLGPFTTLYLVASDRVIIFVLRAFGIRRSYRTAVQIAAIIENEPDGWRFEQYRATHTRRSAQSTGHRR
jgi:hypothetical protein